MARRAYGDGTVYQETTSGRWCAVVRVDGRPVKVTAKTRADVLRRLADLRRAVETHVPVASDRITVAEFLEEWLNGRRQALGPQTWTGYERKVRRQVVPYIGHLRLQKLSRNHVQELYEALLEEGFSAQTVNHIDAILRRALRDAVRWSRVGANVALLVDPPRVERAERRFLSANEARRFLSAAAGDRLEAMYVLAVTTGMRRGELLALHWADVDLDRGVCAVNWNLIRSATDELALDAPKTPQSRRRLTLDPSAVDALRRHQARQAEERRLRGPVWEDNDLVFANEIGRPINPSNLINRSFWPLRDRAGFHRGAAGTPALRFHDLRHTAGSLMLEAGVPLKVVSARLGHANINITADIYLHLTDRLDEQAALAVGCLLSPSGGEAGEAPARKAAPVPLG